MALIFNHRTVVGTIVDVYEKRQVGSDNTSVVNFRIAVTPSVKDKNGEWTDGETDWVDVTAWRRLADNVAKTFNKGDRVIVIGRQEIQPARTDSKTGKEYPAKANIVADYVGLDLTFDSASSSRNGTSTTAKSSESDDEPAPRKRAASKRTSDAPAAPARKKRKPEPEPDEFEDDFEDEFEDFEDDDEEPF